MGEKATPRAGEGVVNPPVAIRPAIGLPLGMADHAPLGQAQVPSAPPRWLMRLAHVRQWLAVALLTLGVLSVARSQVLFLRDLPLSHFDPDPAVLLYLAGAVGLAVRAFWARYLAICVALAILTIQVFWSAAWSVTVVTGLAFILLLSGPSMRSHFEDRPGQLHGWTAGLDQRIGRLRILFVAQSMALAMLWVPGAALSPIGRPVTLLAGLALAGLVFQRTWGALLMPVILVAEVLLALLFGGLSLPWRAPPAWCFTLTLLAAAGTSAVVIAPFVRAFGQRLAAGRR